jgi:WD40 repeat protein
MKYLTTMLYALTISAMSSSAATGEVMDEKKNTGDHSQHVTLLPRQTIDLGGDFYTTRLAFSPDGNFLAIGDQSSPNIIVWDIKDRNRRSTIYARSGAGYGGRFAHWDNKQTILWSPDGGFITNGIGIAHANGDPTRQEVENKIEFWDPMTGKVLKLLDGYAPYGRLNNDGSKLLSVAEKHNEFYVFNIPNSTKETYQTQGVVVTGLTWAASDDIVVIGTAVAVPNWGSASMLNGEKPEPGTLVAQIFPRSKTAGIKTLQLAAPVSDKKTTAHSVPAFSVHNVVMNSVTNRVAVEFSGFIDGKNSFVMGGNGGDVHKTTGVAMIEVNELKVSFWKFNDELSDLYSDSGSITFSPDGRYLFILSQDINVGGVILNAKTGAVIGKLPYSEFSGIAVSPDGTLVAIGQGRRVELYTLSGI